MRPSDYDFNLPAFGNFIVISSLYRAVRDYDGIFIIVKLFYDNCGYFFILEKKYLFP